MVHYVPIFKGKQGEFQAWSHAASTVHARSRPVFEVVPELGAQADLTKFLRHAVKDWPEDQVLTYDVGALDTDPLPDSGLCPTTWVSRALHEAGVGARPIIRLDDDPRTLDEAAAVDQLHGHGVCIRVGSEESDPDAENCDRATPDLLARIGIEPTSIELLCDLREVDSERTVGRVAPVANAIVAWASGRPWRFVTVASGAFPASLSNFAKGEPTPIRRHDADLWRRLVEHPNTPDFGDYVVAHPSMPTPAPRGPLPNLRFTNEPEWWIWRENRDLPGNDSMRTLCRRVVASDAFTAPEFSWGDAEVNRVADGAVGGTGGAAQWRAWGSSRHLAVVTDRLATLSVP